MNCVKITPNKLKGNVNVPASKSAIHRALICSALAKGKSIIKDIGTLSIDITSTIEALKELGSKIEYSKELDCLEINSFGISELNKKVNIFCHESGSTLRFLIPVAMLFNSNLEFTGSGRLITRPLDTYYKIFNEKSIKYKTNNGNLPLYIEKGTLPAGEYTVSGKISSQFITGLLMSLAVVAGDSKIIIEDDLESKPYVDMTLETMKTFGVHVENYNYNFFQIEGSQKYAPCTISAPKDYSQAAFWLCAGALGNGISCCDLPLKSSQGDKEIIDILRKAGCQIIENENKISVSGMMKKDNIIDVSQCPDLVPILAATACVSPCNTKIINAERLKYKESDRLLASSMELNKLGAKIKILNDTLEIEGTEKLSGGKCDSHNDHRIVMALAIASTKCTDDLIITNCNAINKSYVNFWEDFRMLGGKINEFNME